MILAVSPLLEPRGCDAYRVVLRSRYQGGYAVHCQFFPDCHDLGRSYLGSGDYFPRGKLAEAMVMFGNRVIAQAKHASSVMGDLL